MQPRSCLVHEEVRKTKVVTNDHVTKDEQAATVRIAVSSCCGYFLVYFLRYPIFMLPEEVLGQTTTVVFGVEVDLLESLTFALLTSMTLAKVPAIRLMSSPFFFRNRLVVMYSLVLVNATFGTLPLAWSGGSPWITTTCLFVARFFDAPLYGAILSYLEGRRSTEILVALLGFSFVFAGGVSRAAAVAVLGAGVDPLWTPALIATLVTPAILVSISLLESAPPPSARDMAERRKRRAMTPAEQRQFVHSFWPGIFFLVSSHTALTALRQFRDLFVRQLFTAANGGTTPGASTFFLADVPGSLFGALALASMGKIADGKTALNTMLFVMTMSMAMAGLMTHAYSNGMMDGISWQVFVGAGIYGAYTLGNPAPFDRLVSVSDIEGATCTFLVFTADLFGYVATVVLMLWKTFSESGQVQSDEIVQQFVNALSIVVCIVVVCLSLARLYFSHRLPGASSSPPPPEGKFTELPMSLSFGKSKD